MKPVWITSLFACAVLAVPAVASAKMFEGHAEKVQCEKQAKEQKLKGKERSEFIKSCVAKAVPAAATGAAPMKHESKKEEAHTKKEEAKKGESKSASGMGMAAAAGVAQARCGSTPRPRFTTARAISITARPSMANT
jgi:psiF repeat.